MKKVRCWLHMSTLTSQGKYIKNFYQTVQKQWREEKEKKKKKKKKSRIAFAKLFGLHTNAINLQGHTFMIPS